MAFAVTSYSDGAVGILSARIISLDQTLNFPESITQLQVDEDRYALFKVPSETIDNKILSIYINPINTAKQTIITNGNQSVWTAHEQKYSNTTDPITALNTLYGEITDKNGVYSDRQVLTVLNFNGTAGGVIGTITNPANPPSGSASIGAAVVQGGVTGKLDFAVNTTSGTTGRAIVRDVAGGSFVTGTVGESGITGLNTVFIGGKDYYPTSIEYVGLAHIYEDVDAYHHLPNLEPPNTSTDDIFGSAVNRILTASGIGSVGVGFANTFFPNGLNTSLSSPTPSLGVFIQSSPSVSLLGDVYTFNTTSGSSQVSNINAQKQIIKDLRFGVVSTPSDVGIGSFNAASVAIKQQKKSFAVNTWSGKRMRVVANTDKGDFESAIAILTNSSYQ